VAQENIVRPTPPQSCPAQAAGSSQTSEVTPHLLSHVKWVAWLPDWLAAYVTEREVARDGPSIQALIYLFTHLLMQLPDTLTHSLAQPLARSLAYPLAHFLMHLCAQSITHSSPHSLTHSFTHSLTHSLIHSLTHSLTHPFTHPLTHPLTHSLTHPLIHSLLLLHLLGQIRDMCTGVGYLE